jgi:hypothetical protein
MYVARPPVYRCLVFFPLLSSPLDPRHSQAWVYCPRTLYSPIYSPLLHSTLPIRSRVKAHPSNAQPTKSAAMQAQTGNREPHHKSICTCPEKRTEEEKVTKGVCSNTNNRSERRRNGRKKAPDAGYKNVQETAPNSSPKRRRKPTRPEIFCRL